jgi:hypothetical protein
VQRTTVSAHRGEGSAFPELWSELCNAFFMLDPSQRPGSLSDAVHVSIASLIMQCPDRRSMMLHALHVGQVSSAMHRRGLVVVYLTVLMRLSHPVRVVYRLCLDFSVTSPRVHEVADGVARRAALGIRAVR